MKIKSQTWILLVIFALMIGSVFYLNNQKKVDAAKATPTSGASFIFTAADGNVNSIEIKSAAGESVKVARNASNAWALILPSKTEADQSSAEAAATQVSALQVTGTVPSGTDPSVFGLDKPTFVFTLGFADGKIHILEVGDLTPTQSGYYVRLDKGKIMIVSTNGINALAQLTSSPPYLNTPTPTALPATETPVPPTDAVSTPDLSVTPTP